MSSKRRILFFIGSLGGGGAERAVITYCANLDRKKFEVSLMLLTRGGSLEAELPADVRVFDLQKRSRWGIPAMLMRIRDVVKTVLPDLIVSNLTYCNLLMLSLKTLFRLPVPVIVIDHVHLSSAFRYARFAPLRRFLIRLLYPRAVRVINVSSSGAKDLVEQFAVPGEIIECIYDPVDLERIRNLAEIEDVLPDSLPNDRPVVLAVGRLTHQKDYPTLLRAFKIVLKATPACLVILGTGEEYERLTELVRDLGIERSVMFMGFQPNPYPFFRRADCFVLSSRYEGFGIVIVEAMACGCPVIATDCPSGPAEIISSARYGLLSPVGDPGQMGMLILKVLGDSSLRESLKEAGESRARDFSHLAIVATYEQLFEQVITTSHP